MNTTNFFFKSGPFKLRQFGWRDLWRSHVICTDVAHGVGMCLACYGVIGGPAALRRVSTSLARAGSVTQSRQTGWRN
jgi:hypothetical protein